MNQFSTRAKLAAAVLPLSIALYAASLTMDVARVTGNVKLDSEAIQAELRAQISSEDTLEAAADEISAVVVGVVEERFPMFASPMILRGIEQGVQQQVERRGPTVLAAMVPELTIPEPDAQVRSMKLLETIRELWEHGDEFLTFCLIAFTIFFPITKYIALGCLLLFSGNEALRARTVRWLKSWGQWSMGDVFVVAFLVVWMRINTSVVATSTLAEISVRVDVEAGLYLFAASVILAMICSMLLAADRG